METIESLKAEIEDLRAALSAYVSEDPDPDTGARKHCNGCGEFKSVRDFYRRSDKPLLPRSRCKSCCIERTTTLAKKRSGVAGASEPRYTKEEMAERRARFLGLR